MTTTTFPVVILAGGLATRLRPITEKIPKALIDIQGEPFIIHQLRLLKEHYITDVVICVGYLGDMIKDYLSHRHDIGLNIQYSFDGDTFLGTAGAIKKALPLLSDHFFVLYGDSYLPCDYQSVQHFFMQQNKSGLMTIFRNDNQWDKSNVAYENGALLSYDKNAITPAMKYIDYGLGIFNKNVFAVVPEKSPYDLASLYQHLLKEGKLCAYEVFNRFYEIGSFAGIDALQHHLKREKSLCNL